MNKQPMTTIQDITEKVWSRYHPCWFLENQNDKYGLKEKVKYKFVANFKMILYKFYEHSEEKFRPNLKPNCGKSIYIWKSTIKNSYLYLVLLNM